MEILNLYDHTDLIPLIASWLFKEFILELRPGISIDDLERSLRRRKKGEIPLTFIGMVSKACVGTVSLVASDLREHPELTPWLASLYVDEDYRQRGYGRALIHKVISTSTSLGYKRIYLRTETAAGYYQRLGWQQVLETRDHFGLETTVFSMEIK